jgi:hypothetical protein
VNLAVEQRNLNFIRVFDDVMIGQDVATLCIDNHAGSGARNFPLTPRGIRYPKKAAECVIAKRRGAGRNQLIDADINDGWRNSLDQRRKTRHRFTIGNRGQRGVPGY